MSTITHNDGSIVVSPASDTPAPMTLEQLRAAWAELAGETAGITLEVFSIQTRKGPEVVWVLEFDSDTIAPFDRRVDANSEAELLRLASERLRSIGDGSQS
jgi:hypothetical protein